MTAIGIDLGGTKIEAQVFDRNWSVHDSRRIATPDSYADLVAAVADQIGWASSVAGAAVPVGIGAAGLINPATGLALTANLVASGHPFPADIAAASRPVTYVNDCRALALSEAVFGAGRGHRIAMSLILGTGVGGGIAVDGALLEGPSLTGGEFGHCSAAAAIVAAHDLPLIRCGCGRMGCVETLLAGPGLSRIAEALLGRAMAPPDIAAARSHDPQVAQVWQVWCDIAGELLRDLTLTVDPDVIILGGGLSEIAGVTDDLAKALAAAQLRDFATAPILRAEGGPTSGARGAAYAALQAAGERERASA